VIKGDQNLKIEVK
jgi:hypothetical protein